MGRPPVADVLAAACTPPAAPLGQLGGSGVPARPPLLPADATLRQLVIHNHDHDDISIK